MIRFPINKLSVLITGILLLFATACSRDTAESAPGNYIIEVFATGLEVPWSIAFTSPTRVLVTERPGRIRQIENGVLNPEPLRVFTEVSSESEEGLMGLCLDPAYHSNHFVYTSLAYESGGNMFVKVVRLTDNGHSLSDEQTILDNIPAAHLHAGCRIKFGPDGKLYITTGDATDRQLAQDLNSLAGKLLRINSDGSIPDDNPFPNSAIWSLGHRNSQGMDWHPNGNLYASEHGPSGFDGPGGGDEVNRIIRGGNYGWPVVHHEESQEGMIDPIAVYTPAEAPAALLVYSGDALPGFRNHIFVAALRGEGILHLVINEADPDQIAVNEKLGGINYGRIREIIQGPDGYIYFTSSNRDGRGDPASDDDRIFRIKPKP